MPATNPFLIFIQCLLLTFAIPAHAQQPTLIQQEVTLEKGIIGTTCQPASTNKSPGVLLLHGFAGSKDEVGDIYKRLATQLCKEGIGSLRIAYRGWGESKGRMQDITLQSEIVDADIAAQFLMQLDWVDPKRIGILGFSMGGGIAMITTQQYPTHFKSMATWSSVGDFKQDFLLVLGQKNFNLAEQLGKVTIDLGWRKVTLGAGFFDSLDGIDLAKTIAQYQGAYLAIAGSQDFSAAYTEEYVALSKGSPKRALIVPDGDHIFGVLGEDQTTAEYVIKQTIQWFQQTL